MREGICLIGASGFVGGRALAQAVASVAPPLRVLVHRRAVPTSARLEVIEGDAADDEALRALITPDSTVINFAYGGDERAESLARALGRACAEQGARRLVHVSSCSVYGRTSGRIVDEGTSCRPVTLYERAKHDVEQILEAQATARYDLAILRPSAVFGPGGRNLESLALRVLTQSWPARYVRACLMGRRRMHAVDVDHVAAAALFLAATPLHAPVERFIVSQDDEPMNDYRAIEAFFVERFRAAAYPLAPIAPPSSVMRLALRAAGRSNAEPYLRYSAAKLADRGFQARRTFSAGLDEYAGWIQARHAGL